MTFKIVVTWHIYSRSSNYGKELIREKGHACHPITSPCMENL